MKSVGTEKSPNGDIPTEAVVSDYKKVDGILIAFKTKQKVLNNEIIVTLEKVEQNVEIPAKRFDVPEEVKKLIGK